MQVIQIAHFYSRSLLHDLANLKTGVRLPVIKNANFKSIHVVMSISKVTGFRDEFIFSSTGYGLCFKRIVKKVSKW